MDTRTFNISDPGLAQVMGFGITQEIFMETYQRPLIVNIEKQAETKSRLRGVCPLGLPGFHGSGFAAVGEVLSLILASMQKPITSARPFDHILYKGLDTIYCGRRFSDNCCG